MSQNPAPRHITWSLAASLPPLPGGSPHPGLAGSVIGINNNVLIIAGGANFPHGLPWTGAAKVYHDDVYAIGHAALGSKLPEPVAYGASVTTPAGIIYTGGENEHGVTNKVYRLQYHAATHTVTIHPLPPLPIPLTNLTAAWHNNQLFVAGGESQQGPSQQFFCLDASLPGAQWQSLPNLPHAVTHAVLVAQSNGHHTCLYLTGGRMKNTDGISTIYDQTYCYDINTRQWTPKQPLPYPLSAASAIAWGAHGILVLGGDKGEVFSAVEKLAVKINAATDTRERDALTKQKNELLAAHPGFNKDILLYNTLTNTWTTIGQFPYAPVATTTALNRNGDIIIPSGEIRAGVRTSQIIQGTVGEKNGLPAPKKHDKK